MKEKFKYTLDIDGQTKSLLDKVKEVKKTLGDLAKDSAMPGVNQALGALTSKFEKVRQTAAQPITSIAMFNSIQKGAKDAEFKINTLEEAFKSFRALTFQQKFELLPKDFKQKVASGSEAIKTYGKEIEKAQKKTEAFKIAEALVGKQRAALAEKSVELVKRQVEATGADKAQKTADSEKKRLEKQKKNLEEYIAIYKKYNEYQEDNSKPEVKMKDVEDKKPKRFKIDSLDDAEVKLEKVNEKLGVASQKWTAAKNANIKAADALKQTENTIAGIERSLEEAEKGFEAADKAFKANKKTLSDKAYTKLREDLEGLGVVLDDIPIENTTENVDLLKQAFEDFKNSGVEGLDTSVEAAQGQLDTMKDSLSALKGQIDGAGESVTKFDAAAKNTEALTTRVKAFVGFQGAIQLARTAMSHAFKTVKELDAAMTEMAVVTDADISDYWDELPVFTQRANEFGVSIKSAYESAQLFYQQGLKQKTALELSNQTLKMARIANLDAAEATDRMTSALRGFNMELNEANAERVADVYSELAAVSAADVDEISVAMSKVASIASSAGMEFETTAAFLTAMIENTREPAEALGTALVFGA